MRPIVNRVIYRGHSPKPIKINYDVKKPDLIYRGFKVNSSLLNKPLISDKLALIYRGIKYNGLEIKNPLENLTLQFNY